MQWYSTPFFSFRQPYVFAYVQCCVVQCASLYEIYGLLQFGLDFQIKLYTTIKYTRKTYGLYLFSNLVFRVADINMEAPQTGK